MAGVIELYMLVIFIWIMSSWFPQIRHNSFLRFIGSLSEPYLRIFRSVLPPIGGVLDISPILAFFVLGLLRNVVFMAFRGS